MWTGKLKPQNVLGVLRDFAFVMLGPLGEAPYRAAPGRSRKQIDGPPPDDWHLGALPPEIAVPVLLTCAIFVAHETEIRIAGVSWDRRVLADGEAPAINTETMVWHLTFAEGEMLRKIFGGPQVRPFRGLLSALAADRRGLAADHEANAGSGRSGALAFRHAPRRDPLVGTGGGWPRCDRRRAIR
jgi:hypothetical protein